MIWNRYLEIIINLAARGTDTVLRSASSTTTVRNTDFVQADKFPLRLRFALPTDNGGNPFDIVALEEGSSIVFSGKDVSVLGAGALLYYADDFVGGSDAIGPYYDGLLNTNTASVAAIFAELSASKDSVTTRNEIEVQNGDQRTSYQHVGILRRQVYTGAQPPTPAEPPYPTPGSLLTTSALRSAEIPIGQPFVDCEIPAGERYIIPWGVQMPDNALDADLISLLATHRLSPTTIRGYLSASPNQLGYTAYFFVPAKL